jgi:hypothetical protein
MSNLRVFFRPDHGCPNGEKNVLEFMDVLNKLRQECDNKGPLLLHCRWIFWMHFMFDNNLIT